MSYKPGATLDARPFHRAAIFAAETRRLLFSARGLVSDRHSRERLQLLACFAHNLVLNITALEREIELQLEEEHQNVV